MSDSISHPLSPPPSAQPMHPRRLARDGRSASGFTLVEILTVISIIVVLIGLLFVAIKYARNSAARSTTAAQMDTLRGMLGELDSANHFSQGPRGWLWYDATGNDSSSTAYNFVVVPNPDKTQGQFTFSAGGPTPFSGQTLYADFWKYPFAVPSFSAAQSWDALDSPGDVRSDSGTQSDSQRNASFAVLNTQMAMQLLATVPANKAAIAKMSASSTMTPVWNAGPVLQAQQSGGSSFLGLLKEDGTDAAMSPASSYTEGIHVTYQGKYYVCIQPTATNTAIPGINTACWQDETSLPPRGVPVLLDGWGNPIIYVPATGLHVKLLNGLPNYLAADPASGPTQEFIIISPEGSVSGNGTSSPVVIRPGRPFFASAGPDGDFTKGDDNIYSFQN